MTRLNRDVLSGLVFVAIGAAGLWIGRDYALGTPFRMGPGYFPRMLCAILVGIGLFVAVKGLIVKGEAPDGLHWRPLLLITLAVVGFAGLITTAGLAPAALAVVLLGAAGGPEFRMLEAAILAVLLAGAAVALFIFGLGMPLAIFNMPSLPSF